jgi:hypothetical protein
MFYIILLIGIAALILNILDENGQGLAKTGRRLLPHVYPFVTGFCLSYCVILYYEASHRTEPARQESSVDTGNGVEESDSDTDDEEEADEDASSEEEEEEVEDVQPVKAYT